MTVHIDDCQIIPVSDGPDNARWLVWHETAGAHSLAVLTMAGGRRIVELTTPRAGLALVTRVGTELSFVDVPQERKVAPLPPGAPAGGPELYAAAIAALKSWFAVGALRIRPGFSEASLRETLDAAAALARIANPMDSFGTIPCDLEPTGPVKSTADLDTMLLKQHAVFQDIRHFYRPYAPLGPGLVKAARAQGVSSRYGLISAAPSEETPSAHAVMRHGATILAFYDLAAPTLKLTPEIVAGRLSLLEIAPRREEHP